MFVNQLYQGGIRALIAQQNNLFDGMVLPQDEDGNTYVGLYDIVDRILFKYGDTPLFCPDPAVMKFYITLWSERRVKLWERFAKAVLMDYNPIENYDRTEDSSNEFSPATSYENMISADNASTYQPDRKTVGSGKDTNKYNSRIHGNIGVTTSQQMLQSELDIIPKLDIVDFIVDDWHNEFCLFMYN